MHDFWKTVLEFIIEQWGSLLGTLVLGAGSAVWLRAKKGLKKLKKLYSISHLVETDIQVYTHLSELMLMTNTVRAFVFQLHNGAFYLNASNQMKMSCTHEVTKEGFAKEGKNMQDILLSQYSRAINDIVQKEYVFFNTDVDPHYAICQLLKSQGVKLAVLAKLSDGESMEGFIGITYWEGQEIDWDMKDPTAIGLRVKEAADSIGFLLRGKK